MSAPNRGKQRKVNFLVLSIQDTSRHKPQSSPISSPSFFSFRRFFFLSNFHFFPSLPLPFGTSLHFPPSCALLLSLFANTDHEHHYTVFRRLRHNVQKHGKAFRVRLKCQKAIKQSKTLNMPGNASPSKWFSFTLCSFIKEFKYHKKLLLFYVKATEIRGNYH